VTLIGFFQKPIRERNCQFCGSQQFGAKQGQFGRGKRNHPIPWGDIPARPFFPDPARGLPEPLQQSITEVLRIALRNAAGGGTV
jgi:hypothetical protein